MEFICVLSVEGSLTSYQVRKVSENNYSAMLTSKRKNDNVPLEISLVKENEAWQAQPWHEEIVPGLTHAIDASK